MQYLASITSLLSSLIYNKTCISIIYYNSPLQLSNNKSRKISMTLYWASPSYVYLILWLRCSIILPCDLSPGLSTSKCYDLIKILTTSRSTLFSTLVTHYIAIWQILRLPLYLPPSLVALSFISSSITIASFVNHAAYVIPHLMMLKHCKHNLLQDQCRSLLWHKKS